MIKISTQPGYGGDTQTASSAAGRVSSFGREYLQSCRQHCIDLCDDDLIVIHMIHQTVSQMFDAHLPCSSPLAVFHGSQTTLSKPTYVSAVAPEGCLLHESADIHCLFVLVILRNCSQSPFFSTRVPYFFPLFQHCHETKEWRRGC